LLLIKAKAKGIMVAIVAGTKTRIIEQVSKINSLIEITLDMANSMKLIAKKCFPKTIQVTDRFSKN
jgi:hypothetical protein